MRFDVSLTPNVNKSLLKICLFTTHILKRLCEIVLECDVLAIL